METYNRILISIEVSIIPKKKKNKYFYISIYFYILNILVLYQRVLYFKFQEHLKIRIVMNLSIMNSPATHNYKESAI